MITVLYTKDLEPITCIDIPIDVLEDIERKGLGKVPVLPRPGSKDIEPKYMYLQPIRILGIHNQVHVFLTTKEEELALAITPQFLPGQLPLIQHQQHIIREQQRTLRRLQGGDTT